MTGWVAEHGPACWSEDGHEDCALKATLSLLQARIAHDQARTAFYRSALKLGGKADRSREAVGLAREELLDNHRKPHRTTKW